MNTFATRAILGPVVRKRSSLQEFLIRESMKASEIKSHFLRILTGSVKLMLADGATELGGQRLHLPDPQVSDMGFPGVADLLRNR